MLSILLFVYLAFSSETLNTNIELSKNSEYKSVELAIVIDELGFYPINIFLKLNSSLNLKVANILNKDASFTNSKLGVYKGIKPKSADFVKIKFDKPGSYEFLCPINKAKMNILVD